MLTMGGCGSSRGEDQRNQAEAASGRLEPGEGQPSAAGGSGVLHLGDRAGAGDSLPHPGSLAHTRPCNRTASWPLTTAKSIFHLPPHPSPLLCGGPQSKNQPGASRIPLWSRHSCLHLAAHSSSSRGPHCWLLGVSAEGFRACCGSRVTLPWQGALPFQASVFPSVQWESL